MQGGGGKSGEERGGEGNMVVVGGGRIGVAGAELGACRWKYDRVSTLTSVFLFHDDILTV